MTRQDIILQILIEASGGTLPEAESLLAAMVSEEFILGVDLDDEFSDAEAESLLEGFRQELPGIRRWLSEAGLLNQTGHA